MSRHVASREQAVGGGLTMAGAARTEPPPRPISAIASGKPRRHSEGAPRLSGGGQRLSGGGPGLSGDAESPSGRAVSLSARTESLSGWAQILSGKEIRRSGEALSLSGRGKSLSGRAFCTIDRGDCVGRRMVPRSAGGGRWFRRGGSAWKDGWYSAAHLVHPVWYLACKVQSLAREVESAECEVVFRSFWGPSGSGAPKRRGGGGWGLKSGKNRHSRKGLNLAGKVRSAACKVESAGR